MPNLGFVNAELIVQEGGLAPLVELLSSSNEVGDLKSTFFHSTSPIDNAWHVWHTLANMN
jgi:hypothetical protein